MKSEQRIIIGFITFLIGLITIVFTVFETPTSTFSIKFFILSTVSLSLIFIGCFIMIINSLKRT